MQKNITGLRKLKIEIIKYRKKITEEEKKEKKKNLHRTAKGQHRGRGICL